MTMVNASKNNSSMRKTKTKITRGLGVQKTVIKTMSVLDYFLPNPQFEVKT